MASIPSLVTTQWLNDQMKSPEWKAKFRLLDGTWDLPRAKRNVLVEHESCRISGAKYFSVVECRNKEASLPFTVPELSFFEEYVSNLGIRNDHHIIVYDNSEAYGLFSAPRVWWLFRYFGHDKVSVVDGGLPRWKKDGFNTVSGAYSEAEKWEVPASKFKAVVMAELIKDTPFIMTNFKNGSPAQVVDVRSEGRFRGTEPEPNPRIPSGHIPDTFNIPYETNYNAETKTMLTSEEIRKNLKSRNVDMSRPVVSMCGAGMTSCSFVLAVQVAYDEMIPMYDDSWTGWQKNTPDELQVRQK